MIQPTNQALYAGQATTLTSLALASQPLNYQWYFDDNALMGQTNANLSFVSVQLGDAGQYFVIASNALGIVVSLPATLTVQPIARCYHQSTNGYGWAWAAIWSSTPRVNGTSPVSLQWYRDGVAITGATGSTYSLDNASEFDAVYMRWSRTMLTAV
ncbi:MAG: immunoglobulin domain-containing protein [Limisphaerales bacterium]